MRRSIKLDLESPFYLALQRIGEDIVGSKLLLPITAGLVFGLIGVSAAQDAQPASSGEAGSAAPLAQPAPAVDAPSPASASLDTPSDAHAPAGPLVAYRVHRAPPTFIMMTPGKGAFAMIGAVAAIADGKRLAKEHGLEDPADTAAAELASDLARARGGTVANSPILLDDDHKDLVSSNIEKARFIVDVAATGITAAYFPFDWTHYGLTYSSAFRVIDGSTGAVLAKGRCGLKAKKTPESPTYDELMANDGARLKAMIGDANSTCLAQFKPATLGVGVSAEGPVKPAGSAAPEGATLAP